MIPKEISLQLRDSLGVAIEVNYRAFLYAFTFFNVVLYIEKGNSLSVRTGFLVELVSS